MRKMISFNNNVYFEVIDMDNGDVIIAVIENDVCVYLHTYEKGSRALIDDIKALKNGADPIADGWDGNADNNDFSLTANDLYKQIIR